MDVLPTITDALGVAPDLAGVGRSLLAIAGEPGDPDRLAFAEYHAANSPSGGFMIATARWKHHHYVA